MRGPLSFHPECVLRAIPALSGGAGKVEHALVVGLYPRLVASGRSTRTGHGTDITSAS